MENLRELSAYKNHQRVITPMGVCLILILSCSWTSEITDQPLPSCASLIKTCFLSSKSSDWLCDIYSSGVTGLVMRTGNVTSCSLKTKTQRVQLKRTACNLDRDAGFRLASRITNSDQLWANKSVNKTNREWRQCNRMLGNNIWPPSLPPLP